MVVTIFVRRTIIVAIFPPTGGYRSSISFLAHSTNNIIVPVDSHVITSWVGPVNCDIHTVGSHSNV